MTRLPIWAQLLIVTMGSFLLGGGAIWYSTTLESGIVKTFLNEFASIIIASGLFAWWGAYVARVQIARHFSRGFEFAEAIKAAGVVETGKWPLDFPSNSKKIDILFIRGHSLVAWKSPTFTNYLKNEGAEMRVCTVHPQSPIVPALATKFDENEAEVAQKILDTITSLVEIGEREKRENPSCRLLIRGHYLIPSHTYYSFDGDLYMVWYSMRRGRQDVPLLRLGSGSLADFFRTDFERVWGERDTENLYDSIADQSLNIQTLSSIGVPQDKLQKIFP